MRVILSGGGTGGHIYPALAIGQAIKDRWPEAELLYVGTKDGMESTLVPAAGLDYQALEVVGWQRKVSLQALQACCKTLTALRQAKKIIKDFSPDLVIGTGGYACLPVVWAATKTKVPAMIHEQNVLPGITNRFLSLRVNAVMLTFEDAKKYLPARVHKKCYLTGLPIRSDILRIDKEEGLRFFGFSALKPILLVTGGSRGAESVNKAMLSVYADSGLLSGIQIIHLTGKNTYEKFLGELTRKGIDVANNGNIIVKPYLNEMEYALACADFCVARAGAAFLSEMTARGIPGILIPYPYAAGNHQEYNARSLLAKGAVEMLLDGELKGDNLKEKISSILFDRQLRDSMAKCSLQAGKPEAIEKVIQVVKKFIQ